MKYNLNKLLVNHENYKDIKVFKIKFPPVDIYFGSNDTFKRGMAKKYSTTYLFRDGTTSHLPDKQNITVNEIIYNRYYAWGEKPYYIYWLTEQ